MTEPDPTAPPSENRLLWFVRGLPDGTVLVRLGTSAQGALVSSRLTHDRVAALAADLFAAAEDSRVGLEAALDGAVLQFQQLDAYTRTQRMMDEKAAERCRGAGI